MSGRLQTSIVDGDGVAGPQLAVFEPDADQVRSLVQQIREMVRYVDSARDAVLLVRRSNAVGKLVDEALKSCRMLEELQFELRQDTTEAHLRTLRRAGELLAQLSLHPGGRPAQQPEATAWQPPTLRDLGISRYESYRWQRIARLPDDWFEDHIRDCRENRRELTTTGLLLLAKRFTKEGEEEEEGCESRPSGKEALHREYELAKAHISNVIWLDPIALARALDPVSRQEELSRLRRWRVWLDEFELALAR